jgi:hypothetical protein
MSSFLGDPTRLVTGALAGRRSRGRREGLIDVNQGNRRRIDGECLSEYRGPAPNHREVFENGCDSAGAFGTVRGRAGTDFFVCAARMLAIVDLVPPRAAVTSWRFGRDAQLISIKSPIVLLRPCRAIVLHHLKIVLSATDRGGRRPAGGRHGGRGGERVRVIDEH